MIPILWTFALIASIVCYRKKRSVEKRNGEKSILYYFCKYNLELLIPFIIIIGLYLLIPFTITMFGETADLQTLIDFEERLMELKSRTSFLRLGASSVFIIYLIIFLLGMLRLPAEKSTRFFNVFKKYRTTTKYTFIILVILNSVTLFGTQLGEPTNELKLRIKTIREGYSDIQKEVQEIISEEVAYDLYSKVNEELPEEYDEALTIPDKIDLETSSLQDYYEKVKNVYSIEVGSVESLIAKRNSHLKSLSGINSEVQFITESTSITKSSSAPKQLNIRSVNRTRESLKSYRSKIPHSRRVVNLLKIPGARKVTAQVPKILTSNLKTVLIQPWIEAYPILEPIVDTYKSTINTKLESKINKAIDNVTNSVINNPKSSNIEKSVKQQSTNIVRETQVKVPKSTIAKIDKESRILQNELEDIKKARSKLFKSVKPKTPKVTLNSNLSTNISWQAVPEAESYRVSWSSSKSGPYYRSNSKVIKGKSMNHWPKGFPQYYRISSIKGQLESRPSSSFKAPLLSSNGGRSCQICRKSSIGYCHLRDISVCSSHSTYTARDGTRWRCP